MTLVMRADQFNCLAALFEHARGLEPKARTAYFDRECVDEPELRAQVIALLDRHDRGGLLDDPMRPTDVSAEPAPEWIGHFRIIDCLGRGGMGVVYRAEQDQPQRQVALKVMHAGLVSDELRRRFEFETSVLARLQHPGIAQIYEAGTWDAGSGSRPFFAMELVDGVTLNNFVAQARPSIEARLELFNAICDAVQHAHQKGVIHRDLKPANILVTGDSAPKILDFGVARATDADLQATLYTTPGQLVGTLAYMSPEQVSLATDKLDTRSDVYSLGVILYELLAGRLPYDVADGSIASAIRVIEESEPKSLTLTSRALRGDLDTIVLRSLRKRPEDRYQSASNLAADIRRFLNREPIEARAPSAAYQLRKFAQRNKALVGGVIATFVALVLGVIGTGYGMLEMTEQRNEARLQASIVEAVNTFLADDLLAQADPQIQPDRAIPLHVALDRAAEGIEGKFENAPLVEASIRRTIGKTYDNLGRYDSAKPHLTRALDLYRVELGDWHEDTNQCRSDLGILLMNVGEYDRAERLFLDMLAVQKKDLGELHRDTISSLQNLGAIYLVQGRYDQAEPMLLKTLDAIRRSKHVDDGEVAIALNNLGSVYIYMGRLAEAEELLKEGLDLQKRAHGLEHPHTLQAMAGLGTLYANQNRYDDAVKLLSSALQLQRRVLGEEHRNALQTAGVLAAMFGIQGDSERKRDLLREILEVQRRVLGEEHLDTLVTRLSLADVAQDENRREDALASYEALVASFEHAFPDHYLAGMTNQRLGQCLMALERFGEAERFLLRAHGMLSSILGPEHKRVRNAANTLIDLYEAWNRLDLASEWRNKTPAAIE